MASPSQSPDGSPIDNRERERVSKQVGFKTESDSDADEVDDLSAAVLEEDAKPAHEHVETAEKQHGDEQAVASRPSRQRNLIQRSNTFQETRGKSANQLIEDLQLDEHSEDDEAEDRHGEAGKEGSHDNTKSSPAEGRLHVFMRAVAKPLEERTSEELDAIYDALKTIHDPFFARLDTTVKRAVCGRLIFQEVKASEQIFDYGETGDRLFLIWSGRVQLEVPRDVPEPGKPAGPMVKRPALDPGQVFGELAVVSDDNTRKARCTALKRTELLSLAKSDYAECIGVKQNQFLREGVMFLRAVDGGALEGCSETDLQAMTKCLVEEHHIGSTPIIHQGADVDRIIFVKSGFCALTRQLHPRFKNSFEQYSDNSEPLPNPFEDGSGGLKVGQKSVWPVRQEIRSKTQEGGASSKKALVSDIGLGSREVLQKLLKQHQQFAQESSENHFPKSLMMTKQLGKHRMGNTEAFLAESSASDSCGEVVVVETLARGSVVGVMELMEGMTYQHSVVPAPWAEVYVITKLDFIREVSKQIIQRLFCEYKARLADKQLVHRLKQKSRWDHYKRELLEDIRNWNSAMSRGIIDRDDPPPRSVGVSGLPMEDIARVGEGMKLWDKRAQTPPKQGYQLGEQVQQIFHVQCIVGADGRKDVVVDREQRDASMDALEERLLVAVASTRQKGAGQKNSKGSQHEKTAGASEGGAVDSSSLPPDQAIQKPASHSSEHVQRQRGEAHNHASSSLGSTAPSKVSRPHRSPRALTTSSTPRSGAGELDPARVLSLPPLTSRSTRLHQARSTAISVKLSKASKGPGSSKI
eukprot:TRINITY_DN72556_c0_g1_i1.p1 TRINITY_DN72556_c0_g1~~TRINITY_DN72556_c0_g1_i1.p1  ORF type:complete len:808 (-),score=136.60 TRINITY_DN72556_c0_g1_i1:70-2493(-)